MNPPPLRNHGATFLLVALSCFLITAAAWTSSISSVRLSASYNRIATSQSQQSAANLRYDLTSLKAVTSPSDFKGSSEAKQEPIKPAVPVQKAPASVGQPSHQEHVSSSSRHMNGVSQPTTVALAGQVLEGGKAIDFGSLKASDRAEAALAHARQQLLDGHTNTLSSTLNDGVILGLNQDVIDLVGHDLGTFATQQQIQDCARYLRSKAPAGLLKVPESSRTTVDAVDQRNHNELLTKAYMEAGEVTGAFAKTFFMGTMLLPPEARQAIWAVYVWCRRTDEIVDAPRPSDDDMLRDLSSWEVRLERLWDYGEVQDVYDLVLLDVRVKYPEMDITPFMDMIRGMLMDVPSLGQDRYENFEDLHLYCYRVAGTVGLMSLPVFGCAPEFDYATAKEPALCLGVAFQLTNILRDVGEDAVQRGRVYLPQEDLQRFGVTEDQIFAQMLTDNYIQMTKFQIERARMYYERARRGVFMLAPESRLPVQSSLDAYGRILDKIEENGYDNLTRRAYVDKWEKLSIIPFSWYRTQDISRTIPLPGDKPIPTLLWKE